MRRVQEQAFAVYHEGDLYTGVGGTNRKTIYSAIGAAKGVITQDAHECAKDIWEANHSAGYWHELPRDEREKLALQYAEQHFKIMEYGPVKQVWPCE